MTVQEAAEVLRCHPGTVYEYVKQGILPHIKLGQRVMIDRDGMFFEARKSQKGGSHT